MLAFAFQVGVGCSLERSQQVAVAERLKKTLEKKIQRPIFHFQRLCRVPVRLEETSTEPGLRTDPVTRGPRSIFANGAPTRTYTLVALNII